MNEADLIAAYGGFLTPEERAARVKKSYDDLQRMGYRKCHVPGCITLIAIGAGRTICRFHSRNVDPR